MKWFKLKLKIFYIKWVKGQCHHICIFCKYSNECLSEFYEYENK